MTLIDTLSKVELEDFILYLDSGLKSGFELIREKNGKKFGIAAYDKNNCKITRVISCDYDEIKQCYPKTEETYVLVRKGKKYGYVDLTTGKLLTPIIYEKAEDSFARYGLARVCKKGKWGFIDKTGKKVIPTKHAFPAQTIWTNKRENELALIEDDTKPYYIDFKGNITRFV